MFTDDMKKVNIDVETNCGDCTAIMHISLIVTPELVGVAKSVLTDIEEMFSDMIKACHDTHFTEEPYYHPYYDIHRKYDICLGVITYITHKLKIPYIAECTFTDNKTGKTSEYETIEYFMDNVCSLYANIYGVKD